VDEVVLNLLTRKTIPLNNSISDLLRVAVEAEEFNTNFDTLEFALLQSQYGINLSDDEPVADSGESEENPDDFAVQTDQFILVDTDGNPIILDDGDYIEIIE
jgi:hypothetical protein